MKREIDSLDRLERELDTHKQWVQQSIKNVTEDVGNHRLALVKILVLTWSVLLKGNNIKRHLES